LPAWAAGAAAGDTDALNPKRSVRLQVDHIRPISEGGTNDKSNLRVVCSACNKGRSNLFLPPDQQTINVLKIIRRQPRNVQEEVFQFLKRKFDAGNTRIAVPRVTIAVGG